jgi:SAM-dependent methyltransferase
LLKSLATRYGLASREAKWQTYCRFFPPCVGETVLDVGVSRFDNPRTNYFLRRYPYPHQLTGVGVTDLSDLHRRHPSVRFIQADGRELPFEDRTFDVVHSNAVVEHVGPLPEQARFIAELARVARGGFVTTPNRWFPIESHVHVPLIHWLPRPAAVFALRVLRIRRNWEVWLLSSRRFKRLFPEDVEISFVIQRIAGWPATFTVIFRHVS